MAEIMIEETYNHPLRAAINYKRTMRKWTQKELAQKSGYSLATIFRLEHGMMNPTLECLQDVLSALGLELVLEVREQEEA
jgi:transcriptional regulator with XRE-family HTH domain